MGQKTKKKGCENSSSSKMDASPPNLCTNSVHILNNFGNFKRQINQTLFSRE